MAFLAAGAMAKLQITLPNSHTEWEAGAPELVKWKAIDGNLKGRVSVELMEGSDPSNMDTVTTIAENISADNMQLKWNVPKNMKNSNNYAIKIVDENGDEYYGQYFKGLGGKTDVTKKVDKHASTPVSKLREVMPADSEVIKQQKAPVSGKDAQLNTKLDSSRPLKESMSFSADGERALRKNPATAATAAAAAAAANSVAPGCVAAIACAVVFGAFIHF
ncbi:hypothetical protein IWW57_004261 [Coemansia sp. S610]|uniref:Uncharacterized protein n=1 Tax=Coemansia linderi TaxID=2663919 RepID=A0ACC1KEQ2_9FUNG|nr:hypothetical protein IWW57_004261 [Coemansia sp. S610]KAJ2788785.1 hypothetical protein GGI18_002763 [Coemansia linderi]